MPPGPKVQLLPKVEFPKTQTPPPLVLLAPPPLPPCPDEALALVGPSLAQAIGLFTP